MRIIFLVAISILFSGPSYAGYLDVQKNKQEKSRSIEYYPDTTNGLKTYYLNGIPFCEISGDSSYLLVYLDADKIAGYKYFKLWMLYQNNIDRAFLFEPLKALKLSITTRKEAINNILPEPPTQIIKTIDQEKEAKNILTMIGSALQTYVASNTPQTEITDPSGGVYKVKNTGAVTQVMEKADATVKSRNTMYDSFKNSVNVGILRKNTVFQDKGITGNVYFLMDKVSIEKVDKVFLSIQTQDGLKYIQFTPQEGE